MLDSLPYELPELVTRAPLDIHHSTVLPEWVDWNGHMNVAFYVTAFDQASGAFMRNMGLGRRYVDGKLGMTFVLETHVTYDREMREGAPMRFTTTRHGSSVCCARNAASMTGTSSIAGSKIAWLPTMPFSGSVYVPSVHSINSSVVAADGARRHKPPRGITM